MMTRSIGARLFGAMAAAAIAIAPATAQDDSAKTAPPKVGEDAPKFKLTDTDGKEHSLEKYLEEGKTVVLEWFNPGCPVVKKHHRDNPTMKETYEEFRTENVVWLAINSGAEGKQGHGKELNAETRTEWKIEYPVLLDESGKVGRAYGAKTTPHMYVISTEGKVVYMGAIDDRRKPAGEVNYVEKALRQHLAGETITTAETTPYGCGVKYAY